MPGRGNTVIYGKITLSSEIESMDSIIKHLGDVLREHNYPRDSTAPETDGERKAKEELEAAEKKLKELMAGNGTQDPDQLP